MTSMSLKTGCGVPVFLVYAALGAGSVAAQGLGCPEQYNRLMALYRTAPQSAEYGQAAAAYNASCRSGAQIAAPSGTAFAAPGAPEASLPMRGAPSSTVPAQSRAIIRSGGGGSGGHK
jgi:hypothetical protein